MQKMKLLLKRTILFSLITIIAASCDNRSAPESVANIESKLDTAAFISFFKKLDFDSLHLENAEGFVSDTDLLLYGQSLDSIYAGLFPDTILSYLNFHHGNDQQYAVGRFDLDPYHEAYLLRHHGEAFPSAIHLLIYDKKSRCFLAEKLEVVENWGDDGDETVISSTLRKRNNILEITMNEHGSGHEPSDTTFNTLIQEESILLYRIERGHISLVKETVLKTDTVSMGTPINGDPH